MSKVRLYGSTSGYIELQAPAVAPDSTLTLPALAGGFGKVGQVVQTVKTDTFSTSSSSPVDVTGLSVSITPSSATSKVLLIAAISGGHTYATGAHLGLTITGGNTASYAGGTAGNRTTVALGHGGTNLEDFTRNPFSHTLVYLDSPASATAQTYKVQLQTDGGTAYINRGADDTDVAATLRTASSLIAIEVAA